LGIHDDFFELGGDSLQAIQMFMRVEAALGVTLQPGVLIEAPTIAALAWLIDRHDRTTPTVITLQPKGTRPPFFCVPGFDGEILLLAHLSRRLGPDQPFHALYPRQIEDTSDRPIPVPELAAHYAAAIAAADPAGPYVVGGYSAGGLVALEVARRLREDGRPVALVALFDTQVVGSGGTTPHAIQTLADQFGLNARDRVRMIRAVQAMRRFTPQPYAGRVDLFRALSTVGARDLGWQPLLSDLRIHDVRGDHFSMMREPDVEHLGERVAAAIDSIVAALVPTGSAR
jgi:aspartate racemase